MFISGEGLYKRLIAWRFLLNFFMYLFRWRKGGGALMPGFFPVSWEWGRVPCNWENSAVLVQFGENLKENELNKLRKFTLNKHFIQTYANYNPSSDLVLWNLCIAHQIFVLKVFTLAVFSTLGIFGPLLGKKDTIWHWDWVLITDPNSLEINPWMHVYVLEHIVSLCCRTTWWMFTKLGRDEVLKALH